VKSGQIIHGIKQNDIFPILPPQLLQVTGSDISMLEMAKQVISEKSVTDAYAAQTSSTEQTATEILNQQKQTLLKLVAYTDGYRLLEQQLVLLRIYNIIANWTKYEQVPVFNDVVSVIDGVSTVTGKEFAGKFDKKYKTFATKKKRDMEDEYSVISFVGNDAKLPTPREQQQYEDTVLAEKYGKNARQVYINADWLRSLQCIWNIGVTQRMENDSQTELLMYLDNISRIANIVGPQNLNMPHVMQRIAGRLGESAEKLFVQTEQSQLEQARMMMEQMQENQPKPKKPLIKNPATQLANSWTGLGKAKGMLQE
jgi:mRNA-degrading endonuclease YafQ of YafQ-DinJ toxin-antitoxin module